MPGGEDGRKAVLRGRGAHRPVHPPDEGADDRHHQSRALRHGLRAAVDALAEDVRARQDISFACTFSENSATWARSWTTVIFSRSSRSLSRTWSSTQPGAPTSGSLKRKFVEVIVADDGSGFDAGDIGLARRRAASAFSVFANG